MKCPTGSPLCFDENREPIEAKKIASKNDARFEVDTEGGEGLCFGSGKDVKLTRTSSREQVVKELSERILRYICEHKNIHYGFGSPGINDRDIVKEHIADIIKEYI